MLQVARFFQEHVSLIYFYQFAASVALGIYGLLALFVAPEAWNSPSNIYLYPDAFAGRINGYLALLAAIGNAIPLQLVNNRQVEIKWRAGLVVTQILTSTGAGVGTALIGYNGLLGTIQVHAAPVLGGGYLAFGIGYCIVSICRPLFDPTLLKFYQTRHREPDQAEPDVR